MRKTQETGRIRRRKAFDESRLDQVKVRLARFVFLIVFRLVRRLPLRDSIAGA